MRNPRPKAGISFCKGAVRPPSGPHRRWGAPQGAYKRFVRRTKPWRKGGFAALSISINRVPAKAELSWDWPHRGKSVVIDIEE